MPTSQDLPERLAFPKLDLPADLQEQLLRHVEDHREHLISLTRTLIRLDSQNTPPIGAERACQFWLADRLRACGLQPELYDLGDVPGLHEHPLYQEGREYRDRPNLAARRKGSGGGRSLLLSGHIDTVPRGTQHWTRDALGAEIEGNLLFGRGSNDMKAGIATNLFVMECVANLQLPLSGDLLFESVVDEEFGGSNGTLAGRLRGYNADAAILSEPSSLRVCPAQRGGRIVHITFRAAGGVLQGGTSPPARSRNSLTFFPTSTHLRSTAPASRRTNSTPDTRIMSRSRSPKSSPRHGAFRSRSQYPNPARSNSTGS